ncbi:MAG TPA: histidine kinase [Gemmataceae bacterium]|nr:histidine kinase [Gemmataceae bacterium]
MSDHPLLKRRWFQALLIWGAFTLLGLFDVSLSSLYYVHMNKPAPIGKVLALGVADWYVWAFLTPFVLGFANRLPIRFSTWRYAAPIHVAVSICLSILVALFDACFFQWIDLPTEKIMTFQGLLVSIALNKMHLYLFVYWAIIGLSHSLEYYRKLRERELQATRLQGQLAQAQLQVLKMQLHPHFLFNTLNTISALIHQDVEVADQMIARLGEMLRATLENSGTQLVPLRQELDFIQAYLEIEKARLGDRLVVRLDMDPDVSDALVPNLILQPLVENAIRHGIAPFSKQGKIVVEARREADHLLVEISDNGPGLAANNKASSRVGVGLANTRARLEQLYPTSHRFNIVNGTNSGLIVSLVIPLRETTPQRSQQTDSVLLKTLVS